MDAWLAQLSWVAAIVICVLAVAVLAIWRSRKIKELAPDIRKDPIPYFYIALTMALGLLGILKFNELEKYLVGATLTVLAILAFAARYDEFRHSQMLAQVHLIAKGASTLKAFSRWDNRTLCDVISNARKSIEIFDSHFSEGHFLATQVQGALENGADKLKVSVSMLDPDYPFGAQRLLEKLPLEKRKTRNVALEPELQEEYRSTFEHDCKTIRGAVEMVTHPSGKPEPVELTIYKYPTMPSIRAVVVDETEYIFGWFPLNKQNPNHICFLLSASSILTPSDRDAVACLQHHIKEIKEERVEIPSPTVAKAPARATGGN